MLNVDRNSFFETCYGKNAYRAEKARVGNVRSDGSRFNIFEIPPFINHYDLVRYSNRKYLSVSPISLTNGTRKDVLYMCG